MITNTGSELLLKYIKHVEECEGVDFLNTRSAFLTDDERQHLRLLAIGKAEQAEAPSDADIFEKARAAGMFGFEDRFSKPLLRFARSLLATQPTASAAGDRCDLHNFETHRASWRKAIEALAKQDDSGYWPHELKAYDDAMASLDRAALASKPPAGEQT